MQTPRFTHSGTGLNKPRRIYAISNTNKSMEKIVATFLAAFLLFGCLVSNPPVPSPSTTPSPSATVAVTPPPTATPQGPPTDQGWPALGIYAESGKPFTLAIGQQAIFEDGKTSFRFTNVTEDSRCPTGVQCVWAGQVGTEVRMESGSAIVTVTLVAGSQPASVTLNGKAYSASLTAVEPYPKHPDRIAPSDYRATFVVTAK